ncbi:NLR family CARD domain-containing protein 3-like isoform X2 [Salminus brasiliensis]|uniref:NLR family CARD domain-containing protein 3-like isoform X2 n=1 Tax=Salminus brasiliensis TaxID=930266 RepID=UPI003B831145
MVHNYSSSGGEPSDPSGGGEPSCVSMKSDRSMDYPPGFSSGGREPSCVSMKSDRSMDYPPGFSSGGGRPSYASAKSNSSGAAPSDSEKSSREAAPHTHTPLGGTGPPLQDSHQPVDDVLHRVLKTHESSMKKKYESLFEGIKTEENKTLLNRIYTQLYIIEGESEGVNEEHEVLQMEKTPRRHREDTPINCSDIFKPLLGHKVPGLRSVLTKGIAGIGKTVSVQKFILDWAEGKVNQDVDFMFILPFRELNLIKDHRYSLHGLLCDFHPELKDLDPKIYEKIKAVLIFDGLDESRIPLNFEECEKVSDITMTSSVGVLMTNLIKGDLFPSALIWITCRPAAAKQIPPKHINRVTEIQGFNDPQKEEYFRKRISDQDQAQKIISHIKTARSLHIMCHIPVFCWISATVLQRLIKQRHSEIPKTLTEMYSHFLITQTNMKNQKYKENPERDPHNLLESNRTKLLKLAELAFKQLMKGNVIFYEEDLRESGIDVTEASVYSGVFNEIFREECVLYQRKVYCFVHLSFQEFLAAVYVFHCFESEKMEKLQCFIQLDDLLKKAVDKALESQNGHLDLFLRFLLGISLKSNQRLLQSLLTHTHTHSEKTTEYIKSIIKGDQISFPTEKLINLFLCLSEMKDQSLSREIQEHLKLEKHSEVNLSPGQCSALACMLLTSEEVLEELDLKKYNTSEEGYRRLMPAVTVCRRAVLAQCSLTRNSCGNLGSVLQSVNSSLKELDLSNNDLQDSGVELLSAGLRSSHCKLETLRLSGCMVTKDGCSFLASALKSNPSHLKELDLTYNHPGESGVKLLSDLLEDPHYKLENLLMEHRGEIWMKPGIKKYACKLTLDPNTAYTHLSLSEGNRKVEGVKEDQLYPDHPDRFESPQVLSVESLTGRCYWEAECSGDWAEVAVSYRGIKRKGDREDSWFGSNDQSWSLEFDRKYFVFHNNTRMCESPFSYQSGRVGVYLDWSAGTLSFYSISPDTHTRTHILTHYTTFTEPLYAGFRAGYDSSVRVCDRIASTQDLD